MAKLFIEKNVGLVTEQVVQEQAFLTGARQDTRKNLCVRNVGSRRIILNSLMYITSTVI
jgi:hypothetical protein